MPLKMVFDEKTDRLHKGDELPPGIIKTVKVYVAIKSENFRWEISLQGGMGTKV